VSGANSGMTYWEGSVMAQGKHGTTGVSGRGYLEMTGYAGALSPALGAR
jgi:predicted secreted hydrolase